MIIVYMVPFRQDPDTSPVAASSYGVGREASEGV